MKCVRDKSPRVAADPCVPTREFSLTHCGHGVPVLQHVSGFVRRRRRGRGVPSWHRDLGILGAVSGRRILFGRRGPRGRLHGAGDAPCDGGAKTASASAEATHTRPGSHSRKDNGSARSGAQSGGNRRDARGVRGTDANGNALHFRRKPAGRGPFYAGGTTRLGRCLRRALPSRLPRAGRSGVAAPPCLLPSEPTGRACTEVK